MSGTLEKLNAVQRKISMAYDGSFSGGSSEETWIYSDDGTKATQVYKNVK